MSEPETRRGRAGHKAPASRRTAIGRSWKIGAEDPAAVLAGARTALFIMVGVLALLWLIQIINWADGYRLTFEYGIRAHDVGGLPDIITAPFLHFSWAHIESNSGPLFIFGFLAAYRGVGKFVALTGLVVLTSGLAAWFFESSGSVGAGASGVVFGYFGYIMVRGFFDRHVIDMVVGVVMALCFAYQFTVLLPHVGVGYQAHIGGLVGGILGGWLLRDRRTARGLAVAGGDSGSGSGSRLGSRSRSGSRLGSRSGSRSGSPGTAVTPAADTGTTTRRSGDTKPADPYAGPRADLHKQLDDLGL
jgi:membrane associated rhomboid family serine protease